MPVPLLLPVVTWAASALGESIGGRAGRAAAEGTTGDAQPSWWDRLLEALGGRWWGIPLAAPLVLLAFVVAFAWRGPALLQALAQLTAVVLSFPVRLLQLLVGPVLAVVGVGRGRR